MRLRCWRGWPASCPQTGMRQVSRMTNVTKMIRMVKLKMIVQMKRTASTRSSNKGQVRVMVSRVLFNLMTNVMMKMVRMIRTVEMAPCQTWPGVNTSPWWVGAPRRSQCREAGWSCWWKSWWKSWWVTIHPWLWGRGGWNRRGQGLIYKRWEELVKLTMIISVISTFIRDRRVLL